MSAEARPAFYALRPGGWRDYVTLVHPPYTLWHLSYVAIGAGLAPHVRWLLLGATAAAFLLAMGVGAHALDELHGRPLATRIPSAALVVLAFVSIAGAIAIGIAVALATTHWLFAFVGFGGFVVVAYNLELFGGRFHSDAWFAVAWGGFPVLTGYFAQAERLRGEAFAAALSAALLSLAQRRLSTLVRTVRRRAQSVEGRIRFPDGRETPLDADGLLAAPEGALRALVGATAVLAAALLLLHA